MPKWCGMVFDRRVVAYVGHGMLSLDVGFHQAEIMQRLANVSRDCTFAGRWKSDSPSLRALARFFRSSRVLRLM